MLIPYWSWLFPRLHETTAHDSSQAQSVWAYDGCFFPWTTFPQSSASRRYFSPVALDASWTVLLNSPCYALSPRAFFGWTTPPTVCIRFRNPKCSSWGRILLFRVSARFPVAFLRCSFCSGRCQNRKCFSSFFHFSKTHTPTPHTRRNYSNLWIDRHPTRVWMLWHWPEAKSFNIFCRCLPGWKAAPGDAPSSDCWWDSSCWPTRFSERRSDRWNTCWWVFATWLIWRSSWTRSWCSRWLHRPACTLAIKRHLLKHFAHVGGELVQLVFILSVIPEEQLARGLGKHPLKLLIPLRQESVFASKYTYSREFQCFLSLAFRTYIIYKFSDKMNNHA